MTDTSDTSVTRATQLQHECDISDASETQGTRVRHKFGTSTTRTTQVRHERKFLILITTLVKTYFHTLILTIYQVNDYKKNEQFHSKN